MQISQQQLKGRCPFWEGLGAPISHSPALLISSPQIIPTPLFSCSPIPLPFPTTDIVSPTKRHSHQHLEAQRKGSTLLFHVFFPLPSCNLLHHAINIQLREQFNHCLPFWSLKLPVWETTLNLPPKLQLLYLLLLWLTGSKMHNWELFIGASYELFYGFFFL